MVRKIKRSPEQAKFILKNLKQEGWIVVEEPKHSRAKPLPVSKVEEEVEETQVDVTAETISEQPLSKILEFISSTTDKDILNKLSQDSRKSVSGAAKLKLSKLK